MQVRTYRKRLAIFSAVLSCALVLGGGVSAQETEAEQDDAPGGIESITVTAEKRQADLQDMGVSIQAFSAEDLERQALHNTQDFGALVPGLTFVAASQNPGQLTISGRGLVHADNHPMQPSTVGMYVDGVYITAGNSTMLQLLDIESVEFLKGPQGTLFGRNTIGGAVIINTKRPTSELEGRVNVRLGNYGRRDIGGTLNVPIIDESLFGRFSWVSNRRDGFWENDLPGNEFDFNDDHDDAARIALRWLASESLTADYIFEWYQLREGMALNPINTVYEVVPAGGVSQETGIPCHPAQPACDQYGRTNLAGLIRPPGSIPGVSHSQPDWPGGLHEYDWRDPDPLYFGGLAEGTDQNKNTWNHSLILDYEISENLSFKFLGGYHEYKMNVRSDQDGTPLALADYGTDLVYDSLNTELQLVGDLLEGAADFVLGFTYFEEEFASDQYADQYGGRDVFFPLASSALNQGESDALGYFAHLNYRPSDRWEFSTGIRYSSEDKDISRHQCSGQVFGPAGAVQNVIDPYTRASAENCRVPSGADTNRDGNADVFFDLNKSASFSAWSPMARVKYYWTDELMTYLKWSKGFNSGGFGPRAANGSDLATQAYEPELLYSWEFGFKSRWFDDRLQFNGAAYYDEHEDQQIATFIPGQGVATRIDNAGKSRIRGWEFDLRALPFDGLELTLNHAFTYATFSEFIVGTLPDGTPNNQARNRVFAHLPKRKWGGSARYTFASQSWGTPELGVTFIRESPKRSLGDVTQNLHITSSTYTLWNSRFSVYDAGGVQGLSVSLQVQNLGDRKYIWGQAIDFGALGWTNVHIADPRNWFVELTYEF